MLHYKIHEAFMNYSPDKSGLPNKYGFQIKVENNKISKLNYFECIDY